MRKKTYKIPHIEHIYVKTEHHLLNWSALFDEGYDGEEIEAKVVLTIEEDDNLYDSEDIPHWPIYNVWK